ncbi:ExbD/TolR family protein [Lyticum sinuosum]|uniref:Tol-Pal system subunit TolR n=1 Tax=Lyticum sinuosum TaxID=1332059 RepID=A0AAE4VK34_9RICK|nr:ExbD/TolR family protein [Lyticum sinuosum]MDZ5761406.1 Tol-Pal system subunit TolR [Lyticum sinuosum]
MGFGINNHNKKGRNIKLNSEINVTPFIDVMLVLLVIFMITTPMMIAGVEVDLPRSNMDNLEDINDDPIIISLTKDNKIYLRDIIVEENKLVSELIKIKNSNNNSSNINSNKEINKIKIFIMGDENISYGYVMKIFGQIKGAGIDNVSLVTENNDK